MTRPPKSTLLRRRATTKGDQELHHPTQLVAAVREEAVITPGDEKHADYVQADAQHDVGRRRVKPEHTERGKVHEKERNR
jgi:hypothetical protein